MCDQSHYSKLDERLTKLERDQYIIDTRQDEQIKTLFQSVKILRNVTYVFAFLMLLTIIYGAVGPKGFNAVTTTAHGMTPAQIR